MQTHRQIHKAHTDMQTNTHAQAHKHTWIHRQTHRQMHKHTGIPSEVVAFPEGLDFSATKIIDDTKGMKL